MSAAVPTVIAGRYELQRRLAQGGMAEVWLAVDLSLDRKVAVKWLKPNLATDEIVAERFRREAVAAASLNHANIVAVHDVFEQDGRQAVVMQLVEGKSLRQLLDAQRRLSPELTCHIGTSVAAALDHAHDAGFVHRDVKPANIMITPEGRVLLTDFGIAKGLHGDGSDDLTSDNIMMGTAKYLSPEQVRGKRLDGRADLYSLGLVLYECLAGRVPFLGETDADTALARLQRDPTDLAQLRATLPRRLVITIHDLLARNPDRRPASGAQLIDELALAREEGPPEIDPTHPGEEPRSPVAPHSAGRLVRAPSDLRGRSADRSRAVRNTTPPRGKRHRGGRRTPSRPTLRPDDRRSVDDVTPATATSSSSTDRAADHDPAPRIPGQPAHVTGNTPVVRVDPPVATSPTHGDRPDDRTPPVGTVHAPPAKGLTVSRAPVTAVVATLITVAAIVAVVVLLSVVFGGEQRGSAPTSVVPGGEAPNAQNGGSEPAGDAAAATEVDVADPPATPADAAPADAAPADAVIGSVLAYDPDGDDGSEENDLVDDVLDGDTSTAWRTSCYSNEWMGGKRGVGIVVSLDTPADRGVLVDVAHQPSLVQFYASDQPQIPTRLDDWGAPLAPATSSLEPAVVASPSPGRPVQHVLVLVQQLGPDDGCSADNPFRGRISEIRLAG